jgi:hypothetical protein
MKPYQFPDILSSCPALPLRVHCTVQCTVSAPALNSTKQHVTLLPSNIPSGFVVYPVVKDLFKYTTNVKMTTKKHHRRFK